MVCPSPEMKAVREVEGTPISQVIIGSCINGRLDMEIAARVLEGKKVADTVTMIVVPASRIAQQMDEALRKFSGRPVQ